MKSEIAILNLEGVTVGHESLEVKEVLKGKKIFAQYAHVLADSARRGEVSGGGKKPWKQKGTGRARQGSTRSPIWKGGGVAHGPQARDYNVKFNKKSMPSVWAYVLSNLLAKEGNCLVLEEGFALAKSKETLAFLKKMGKEKARVLFVCDEPKLKRAFRNLRNVVVGSVSNLNPSLISLAQTLILDQASFMNLKKRLENNL
jgi:large subunit ribosomal protein L4